MLTLLCPKCTSQKTLYHVQCLDCFALQWLLLAAKGKGDAHKRCMHFFIALMLHKGSARSLTLSEVQISMVILHVCHPPILGIISSIFLWPFQAQNLHAMQAGLQVQKKVVDFTGDENSKLSWYSFHTQTTYFLFLKCKYVQNCFLSFSVLKNECKNLCD